MRPATGVKKTNLSAQVQPRGCGGREQNGLKVKEEIGDVAGGVSGVCGVPTPWDRGFGEHLGFGRDGAGCHRAQHHLQLCSWQNEAKEGNSVDFPSWETRRRTLENGSVSLGRAKGSQGFFQKKGFSRAFEVSLHYNMLMASLSEGWLIRK